MLKVIFNKYIISISSSNANVSNLVINKAKTKEKAKIEDMNRNKKL